MSLQVVIDGLVGSASKLSSADALRACLTLEGRIPEADSWTALSVAERFAASYIVNANPNEPAANPGKPAEFGGDGLVMAFRPHGRLYLLTTDELPRLRAKLTIAKTILLPRNVLEQFRHVRSQEQAQLDQCREQALDHLVKEGPATVIDRVHAAIEHMAPLVYYVGYNCFSNFYNVGKEGFEFETSLSECLKHVASKGKHAEITELVLVYCLDLLLLSGTYTRAEEMNSAQVNVATVTEFLRAKYEFYRSLAPSPIYSDAESFEKSDLRERVALLAKMRPQLAGKYRFCRMINGLNLRKKEDVLSDENPPLNALRHPERESELCLSELNRIVRAADAEGRPLTKDTLANLLKKGQLKHAQPAFSSDLECLVDLVLRNAVVDTNSDIAMTRGIRDWGQFVETFRSRDAGTACGWTQNEYFCHVVPHPGFEKAVAVPQLRSVLNSISSRMRFNSWHYVPSYFNERPTSEQRGWFYAPRMADIAEWSDMHHTGHLHASVRYSIRSPLPLRVAGEELAGLMDLRVMRQQGQPYSKADLETAILYTAVLRMLYQAVLDAYEATKNRFSIRFGGKDWFNSVYI